MIDEQHLERNRLHAVSEVARQNEAVVERNVKVARTKRAEPLEQEVSFSEHCIATYFIHM